MDRMLIIVFFLGSSLFLQAQNYEVGLLLGTSGYSGDITPEAELFSTGKNHEALGLFARFDVNRRLAWRVSYHYAKISGDDANATDAGRVNRNLSFRSNIHELALLGEFNPIGSDKKFYPYLYGGVALFKFNPETVYQGQLVELQPLGTEGQGIGGFEDKYKLTQISIPLGVGFKFRMTDRINLGLELGLRKTFTDYLDDVSGTYVNYNDLLAGNGAVAAALGNRTGELLDTEPIVVDTGTRRGNADKDDWYYVGGLTISYQFYDKNNRFKNRRDREIGCPYAF